MVDNARPLAVVLSSHRRRCYIIAFWYASIMLAIVLPLNSSAQNARLSGEVGLYGELNSISGRAERRPDALGRLFLRPTISIGDAVRLRFNFNLSTDGSSSRQDINYLDLNPRWSWGELHIGDFSRDFSPLTLGGVRMRGGGVTLYPGSLRLSIISGISQRAVTSPSDDRAYRRNLSGLQLGIGRESGTSFTINVVTAKDDLSSLADVSVDTMASSGGSDSTGATNPQSVTPQENLVVSTVGNVSLLSNQLSWRTEISGSAITRDRRSSELVSSDIPEFLTDIFTPRLSSSADYAYTTTVDFNRNALGLNAGYEYIGPGYVSLGLGTSIADQRKIDLGLRYRLRIGQVRISLQHQNDNLIGQKRFTTDRRRATGVLVLRLSRIWSTNINTTISTMDNQTTDTAAMVDNTNLVFRNAHSFRFNRESMISGVNVDYTYQSANEKNPARTTADLTSHGGTVRLTSGQVTNTVLSTSLNYVTTRQGTGGWTSVTTVTLGANWRHPRRGHTISIQTSRSGSSSSRVLRAMLRAEYRFTQRIACQLSEVSTFGRSDDGDRDYDEHSAGLRLTYRLGT